MSNRNASPDSLEFIDALNDDMHTAISLLGFINDLVGEVDDVTFDPESKTAKTIELEVASFRRSIIHISEIIESADSRVRQLWEANKKVSDSD